MHGSSKNKESRKKFRRISRFSQSNSRSLMYFFHKSFSAGLSIFLRLNVSASGRVSLTFKHFKALVSQFKKLEFLWLTKKIACLNSQTLPLNVRCFLVKTKR